MTPAACFLLFGLASSAPATIITLDAQGLTGPTTFGSATEHLDFQTFADESDVQFDGGTVLTNTTFLPADQTSVYGTHFAFNSNPITVTFSSPINDFFLNVLNGNTVNVTYHLQDNLGQSRDFTLFPNVSDGQVTIGFATVGTVITLTAMTPTDPFFDFFIDNVTYNQPLPADLDPANNLPPGPGIVGSAAGPGASPVTSPGTAPEPVSFLLMASGFASLAFVARRRRTSGNIS
jgi:hypothetical protein